MEIRSLDQLQSNTFPLVSRITISEGLTTFPSELFRYSDSLEILDLSNNLLDHVPDSIVRFKKLRILFLSGNRFTEFPQVLGQCTSLSMIGFKSNQIRFIPEHAFPENLRWLILTDNQLEFIPASIGRCKPLEKVALAGNKLRDLPDAMQNCNNLALLRISANCFETLPRWLLSMPRLAWLAYSGNPCAAIPPPKSLPLLDWDQLQVMELLGQGASGVISKAQVKTGTFQGEHLLAVKIFKGDVTSDGYPADEMKLSALLPLHQHLVQVLGQISAHPEEKDGLVFKLIPAGYRNLGLPPDFNSCSRDTFKPGTVFHLRDIVSVLRAVADVSSSLHNNGILHGDLYAHNTLINNTGHTIFGDFGAATYYERASENSKSLERLDVRAFGNLMDDLLNHLHTEERQLPAVHELHLLKKICLLNEVLLRPDFHYILDKLNMLQSD